MVGLESIEEARRMPVASFFFPDDQPRIMQEFLPSVLEQGHGEIEVRFRHFKTGEARWMAYKLLTLPDVDGKPIGFATVSQDVTEQKRLADNLRSLAADLSEAGRRKNEFLAMLAHELRNPLAPIRSAAQILGMPGIPAATSEKALVVIDRQVQMMTRLIEDLLDVARITQGKIELRKAPVDVTPLLRRAAELVQPHVDQRGQTLSFALPAEPCHVLGDGTRLEQAFGNLLHNASKFTRRSGHISVSAECPKADGEPAQVIVRVRDDGIGIPPEMLPGVFDLFKQAGASPAPFDRPGCRVGACPSHRHAARWGSDGRERGPESRQ
jgi:PAS domain S-box-containing protein